MSDDDDNAKLKDLLQGWDNGDVSDDQMRFAIAAYDALAPEKKEPSLTTRVDIAVSKIEARRKKATPVHPFTSIDGKTQLKEKEDIEALIVELAGLSADDYEQQRRVAATQVGMRLPVLDAMVKAFQKQMPEPEKSQLAPRLPWTTAVNGEALIDDLIADLTRYVVVDRDYTAVTAFWALHTYLVNHGYITPRLFITAPQRGCGKSTLVDWLTTVVQKPVSSVNISAAAVFHIVEDDQPTIIIDEADTFLKLKDELRGVLNSGHRKGGYVSRYDARIKGSKSYSTFSAVALSLIGDLPSTLQDRSVRIRLRRRTLDEKISSLRLDKVNDDLARRCARWALDNQSFVANADPTMPEQLYNRVEDNWRPLITLADVIGGEWPERLREIAVRIAALDAGDDQSAETQFLRDIREIFGDQDWLTTVQLLAGLHGPEHVGLTGKGLAIKLKNYDVAPRQERRGGRVERGYLAKDFADTFKRYLGVPVVPDVPDADGQADEVEDGVEAVRASGTNGTSGTAQ